MYTFKSKSLREEHSVETTITDDLNRQQTITAKIEIRYEKLDFKVKTAFNSATAGASDFEPAMSALIQQAKSVGKAKLAEYKDRAGLGSQAELDFSGESGLDPDPDTESGANTRAGQRQRS
jgi:hypothetical protein